MEFYEVIQKRRTIRDFSDTPVEPDVIRRILSAGLRAPSNNHLREWEFIVMTDKQAIASVLKKIPKKVSEKRLDFIFKAWRLHDEDQQRMYRDAIPKQYQMLYNAACLIIPAYRERTDLTKPKNLSALNAFASIWCCIENIFLSATSEGLACAFRIPLGDEPEYLAEVLCIPKGYVVPCYIAIGKPAADAVIPEQKEIDIDERMHFNQW